jgi:transposase
MGRYIEGADRSQSVLFPERLDDWVDEDSTVRVIDVFVEELDLQVLGFERAEPADTGRPAYHPGTLLKIYIYGYLNRVQSSRRLEAEARRNIELLWLTGRLAPDFKTIADFRRDNGEAIRSVCREFVLVCQHLRLFEQGVVAIDGSKFKAVNNRDKNFTERKLQARLQQLEQSHLIVAHEVTNVGHDRSHLKTMSNLAKQGCGANELIVLADRGYYDGEQILQCERAGIATMVPKPLTSNSRADGRFDKRDFQYDPRKNQYRCPAGQIAIHRFSREERGKLLHTYWPSACPTCPIKTKCTPADYRRISRWEHEDVLDVVQARLDGAPEAARLRRQTVEHVFGTLKAWMGPNHFLTRTLPKVRAEMSLQVLAYNMKRAISILGVRPLIRAMAA